MAQRIAVLHGDQTGEELLGQALRLLEPGVLGIDLELEHFDLSLESRRATRNGVVEAAAACMVACGYGLKAATVTPEQAGDVGSPNAILRDRVNGTVIVRTGRRIPGVATLAGVSQPISVVRMAVDDAYNATEWRQREGDDEIAYRTEHISRATCRAVAEYAFVLARRGRAQVFGGPKYTVSPVYEGMLKEEMDAAAGRHPDVEYSPQLIDATYALVLSHGGDALVIPALNRDGDCLSDFVLQLFGSIAGSESLLLGFHGDDTDHPAVVMAEAPHGTAPTLMGKNIANPMAMILAAAALLGAMPEAAQKLASRAVYEAVFECVRAGTRTADLGGHAFTDEFTTAIVERVAAKLAVWGAVRV